MRHARRRIAAIGLSLAFAASGSILATSDTAASAAAPATAPTALTAGLTWPGGSGAAAGAAAAPVEAAGSDAAQASQASQAATSLATTLAWPEKVNSWGDAYCSLTTGSYPTQAACEAAGGSWIIDNSVGTRILPDYGAGWCSNGTTYSGDSPTQKESCETAGSTWVYSLTDNSAGSFNRTYAMVTDEVCWVTIGSSTFSVDGVSQAACTASPDGGVTGFYTTDDRLDPVISGSVHYPQCYIHLVDPNPQVSPIHLARYDLGYQMCDSGVTARWGQPANFVAHDFTYKVKDAAGNNLITTATKTGTAGATDLLSGATVDSTYYEPVWQGWTACSNGSNVYNTACPDGQAPAYYYRPNTSAGLFTLPRYDGMIYGFAGASVPRATINEENVYDSYSKIDTNTDTHDTEIGTNSLVQPLAINVDQPSSYTTAASVLGASTTVSTTAGLDTVATSEVDKSITVLITPQVTTSDYTVGDNRYTTAFYTQDWMYWGSEARDQSNTSAVKWTSLGYMYVLYDRVTADGTTFATTLAPFTANSVRAMSYIPTTLAAQRLSGGTTAGQNSSPYVANQNGIPTSLDGVSGYYQSGGDPLINPNNPTFTASQLAVAADNRGSTALAALYGTASDNDGLIWLGGLGGSADRNSTGSFSAYYTSNRDTATRTTEVNSACANTYYVADDVKLRFAYPAGKEQEPVEHYYYPIAIDDNGQPLYSNGRNDGSGVYDYNCGLSLYGFSHPTDSSVYDNDLETLILDQDQLGNDYFSSYFHGGSSFPGNASRPWDQPLVRTLSTTGDGWTYDRAATTSDSSDRAKESDLHEGDQLPTTQVGFISNGENLGTLPGASAASVGEADTSTTGWRDNVGADIVPDPSVAVLVDSLGRAPADPYDDPQYWYTINRTTTANNVADYTGSYTQATGSTGNLPVNNNGLTSTYGQCYNSYGWLLTAYTTEAACRTNSYSNTWRTSGADQAGSPALTFDQRQYAETATTTIPAGTHSGESYAAAPVTSDSTSYARTSPLLRSVGQQLRQTCWAQGSAATTGSLDTGHNCSSTDPNDPLGQNDNREWVLDTSAEGNQLQDGYHVVNLGAEATYDSDGDGVVTAGEDTGQVYPAYTVPTDKIPEREGYIFMGYQVKAYSTEYTQVAEAECWDYDRWARFRNQSLTISTNATANGVADYLDFTSHYAIAHATTATPLGSTTDAQRVVSTSPTSLEPDNGWGSETTTTCSTGGLGYTYTGTATAAPATYRYEPTEQLTTIYVNGRPYIDGQLGSQTIDGRFVTTNGFEIVDTSQFVVVQPGDQIIAVGQNQDSSGNLVDAWPNDGYGFGGTTTGQYSQDGSDGFEAPVWNVTLEPVWGKAVYYTDRTDPDRYDSATGGDLYPFVPDSLINCGADALGNTLRACRIYPGSDTDGVHNPLGAVAADQDEGWYIDDIVIEGRDYYVRAAGICSDPTLKNQDSCEVAGETWTNTVKPGFDHFQFDHYEAYLDTQLESTSVFGYVTGTKDGTVGQLQPPVAGDNCSGATCVGVDFKLQGLVTTVETTPGPHLVGDYDYNSPDTNTCSNSTYTTKATCLAAGASWNERLGDKLPNLFWGTPTETQPRNYNMPGNWNELKLLGVWRYRVKYLDRTGVTYGTGSSVTYPASNPDRITSGTDADVSWDDRNYFYWDGLWDNNGTITPAEYRVGCPLIGTGTCSGTNATGYNQLSYTIPSTAPTLTGAIFEYYQVWIDGDLITTGGTFAQDPNSGKYLPGDTIAWDLILEHGGDIELMAVWDTYTVVFHGVQNSGSGFLGKITDTQAGLAEGDLPTLPNDNQVTPTDKRAGDHSADGDHARSWVTGNGTDYVFTGRWLTNAGAAWNFTTGGVHPSNSNAVCYGPTGAIVDAQGAYYCAYTLDLWAEWDPGLYSVTFHPMGGDIAANGRNCGTSTNGATCSLYTDPTPAGDGVQYIVPSVLLDDPAHGTCSDTQYTTRATCEAATETWTPDPDYWYNVYLSMEDAFGNYAAADAHAGDNRSAWPDDPTRTGYIFDGWYLEAAYTAENDPALYDTANGHLGWDDATYAAAGGFGECHNPAYTTQTACEAAGATWTDFGSSYKIKRNYNFYAKWKKKTFDLYYDLNAGGDATAAYDTTSDWTTVGDDLKLDLTTVTAAGYDEDQQFDDLVSNAPNFTKAPTRVGYNFTHWSLDAACSPANNTAAPAAVGPVGSYRFPDIDDGNPANDPDVFTIYACWQVRQHKLIYDLNDGGDTVYPAAYSPGMAGLVDGVLRSELMDFGVLVRTAPHYTNDPAGANAPTRPKYTFTGWDLTRACQNPVADTPMPDEDKTIYACWVRLPDPDPDDEPGPSPTPGTPTPGGPSETPASTTPAGQGTTPATPAPSPSATVVAGSTLPVMGSTGAASSALLGFDVLALGLALLAKRRRMLQRAAYQRRH